MKMSTAQMLSKSTDDYQGLAELLAMIRAAAHIHLTHHWQTHGSMYYADHKLFKRIYKETDGQVDGLAEKAIGLGHHSLVEPHSQMKMMEACCADWCDAFEGETPDEMVVKSMMIVREVISKIEKEIESLEEGENLTSGLSNLLEDMADKQEEFVYLLKQRAMS